ncbi:MAG: flavodoxin family protein, partial [Oscillospiraceae bacterium]|nr:flavodoxin family protein [Oscillospiraceae bacterium]
MNITRVCAVYFSATGNTRKVVTSLARALAAGFDAPLEVVDFTLPAAREETYSFAPTDLVIFGTPT